MSRLYPQFGDRLAAEGICGRYYYSDIPILALWGSKYVPISHPATEFFVDCAAGTLPRVSYIDPQFLGEAQGTSNVAGPFGGACALITAPPANNDKWNALRNLAVRSGWPIV